MAPEEQKQRASLGGSGGSNVGVSKSSKKQKQKKVPQRGLGVAQLEKIRIEELKKKDEAAAAAAAMAATAMLTPPPPIPQGTVPLGKSDVLEVGRRSVAIETAVADPASAICSNWNNSCESDHVWPLNSPIPRVQLEYLNQVNVIVPSVPASSSQSSTLLNFQIEPPSNQNYHCSSYNTRIVPEFDKVISMKRPSPFSFENLPPLPPNSAYHIARLNDSISHGAANVRNEYWESLSFSGSSSTPESNLTRGSREDGIIGEVLTLAPPSASLTWPNHPKPMMDPLPSLPSNNQSNFLDHEAHRLYQVQAEELSSFQQGPRKMDQQRQYYYSFLPPAVPQDAQAEPESRNGNREERECIDLELRL